MDDNKNEDVICRKLLNKIKENYSINIIATDKHWSYNKVIECRKRIIHKTKYNKKEHKVEKREKIIKDYKIKVDEEKYLDCNLHIMSKSETCLVEAFNSSLRDSFARFRRKTKAISKSFISLYNSVSIWINKQFFINNVKRYCGNYIL